MPRASVTNENEGPIGLRVVAPTDLIEEIAKTYDAIARRAFKLFEGRGSAFGRNLEYWFQAESEFFTRSMWTSLSLLKASPSAPKFLPSGQISWKLAWMACE